MTFEDLHACPLGTIWGEDLPETDAADGRPRPGYPQPFQLLAPARPRAASNLGRRARPLPRTCSQACQPLPQTPPPAARLDPHSPRLSFRAICRSTPPAVSAQPDPGTPRPGPNSKSLLPTPTGSTTPRRLAAVSSAPSTAFVDVRRKYRTAPAAEQISPDGSDVLMDLKGLHAGSPQRRAGVPPQAPIQVNYLGYPGHARRGLLRTTSSAIRSSRPASSTRHRFTRKRSPRLPVCYQPNDRSRAGRPAVRRDPSAALPENGFVFCSFQQPVQDHGRKSFDIWCRLLQGTEHSVLWLYESNAQARPQYSRHEVERPGHRRPRRPYLGRAVAADAALGAAAAGRPGGSIRARYGAHTTASDALWAGVPGAHLSGAIPSCPGVAASVLQAAELPEPDRSGPGRIRIDRAPKLAHDRPAPGLR